MASSNSPSPSEGRSSPPGTPLTPQSKLRALLATVDTSSDEDSQPSAKRTAHPKPRPQTKPAPQPADPSSDDDDILRPRGRLAARMHAENSTELQSPPGTRENARERVRKLLAGSGTGSAGASTGDAENEEDDEDEAVPARPRKLQPRHQRSRAMPTGESQSAKSPPGPSLSPGRDRSESPGLFVSPSKPASPSPRSNAADSDTDADLPSIKNERFRALVARKRQERLAREAEEGRNKAGRLAAQEAAAGGMIPDDGDDSDATDDDGGRRLTQRSRPTRKASKKALEDMNRETQRLSRSLQLAHEAKTKKKISKSTLFERFNFKPRPSDSSRPPSPASRSRTASQTDTEMREAGTPPSSPPIAGKGPELSEAAHEAVRVTGRDRPQPSNENAAEEVPDEDMGKGKEALRNPGDGRPLPPQVKRPLRVRLPILRSNLVNLGSDDELDVQPSTRSKIDAMFDRLPAKETGESRSMHALRRLAHIDDPEKRGAPCGKGESKPGMTAAELQIALQQRARQQAKLERERRLEFLKSKGIHVQTEEERERELAEVEDIVARARAEAGEIAAREREAAKKDAEEAKGAGGVDPLDWDDSQSDAEYEERDDGEIELSGSEDEPEDGRAGSEAGSEEGSEEGGGDEDTGPDEALFDDEAGPGGESGGDQPDAVDGAVNSNVDATPVPRKASRRLKKHTTIISDDDESDDQADSTPKPETPYRGPPSVHKTASPKAPTSVLRSATKTFIPGLPVTGPAGLGLTQIFAGTMDDSQAGPLGASPSQMMPNLDDFPDPDPPRTAQEMGEDMILNSQPTRNPDTQHGETQGVQLQLSQTQVHGFDSLLREHTSTQLSEFIEPTQDGGFRTYTPLKERFIELPASTMEMAPANSRPGDLAGSSPLARRPGKLRRRAEVVAIPARPSEDEPEGMNGVEYDEFGFKTSAFAVMKNAEAEERLARALQAFNKKKSKAKEMVDEQAEESEDEYAGLGGVDGEDSDDDDASVQEMIDDEVENTKAEEAKLAAFYADRERASDERQVEKLFHDITSGMLRRKRGADYDLSDSDDGGEARRRMKRRQFAKMQRALLADERISKVAENPRNQAFLRTIEDVGSDDDMAFILEPAAPAAHAEPSLSASASADSQGLQRQQQPEPARAPSAIPDSQPGGAAARPPAPQRRVRGGRKPSNIGEVRETLSSLLEEPDAASVIPATDPATDSDGDGDGDGDGGGDEASAAKENRHPRRGRRANPAAVVDRISLKRAGSSLSSSSSSSSSIATAHRAAFATASTASTFKVPALLRRATTNSLTTTAAAAAATTKTAGGEDGAGKIRRAAGRRSGINSFAREGERRAAAAESERRREARRWKGAEGRGRVVGGLFSGGRFE